MLTMTSGQAEEVARPAAARARLVTVEPVAFLVLAIQGGFVALRTLYIEHRLAMRYNYTLPTDDGNTTCGSANATKDGTQAQIESETAIWVAYMKGVSVFMPLFGALIYGAASDFIGRKPILIVSATGHLTTAAIFLGVAYFDLPLVYLVVGEGVLGICGDAVVMSSTAYAYVTDIYEKSGRIFHIILIEVMLYFGFGASQVAVTWVLHLTNSNYPIAFLTVFVAAILNFLYVTVPRVLLETVEKRPFSRGVLRELFSKIYQLFENNANGRRLRIVLLITNMVLYELSFQAVFSVIVIYALGPPFCWSETFVGLYGFIINITPVVVSTLAVRILGLCMSEYWMVYLGFLSGIGMMVTTSLAETTPVLAYVASAVGLLRVLPSPLLRFLVAQQVNSDEQGSLFGAVAVMTSVGNVLSPILLNGIYSYTVKTGHPTVAFDVAAGILAIPLIINGILHVFQPPRIAFQPLDTGSSDDEDEETMFQHDGKYTPSSSLLINGGFESENELLG